MITALLNPRTDLPQIQMPGESLDDWLERVTGYGRSPVEKFLAAERQAYLARKRAEVDALFELYRTALADYGLDWKVDE